MTGFWCVVALVYMGLYIGQSFKISRLRDDITALKRRLR